MEHYPGSLHGHSDWSNLVIRDSTNTISSMLKKAQELNWSTIAFTEHETIANAIEIEKESKKFPDLKIIRGNEIYLTRNGLSKETYQSGDRFYHFVLLAKDPEGHKQIRELSTRAWMRSWKTGKMRRRPTYYRDLEEIIGKNPGHVIASTACLGGYIPSLLLQYVKSTEDDRPWVAALAQASYFNNLFGKDHFYLELQPPAEEGNEQWWVNRYLIEMAKENNLPFILTLDEHYLTKDKAPIHKAFLNAQEGEREVDSFYATTYMMDEKEILDYLNGSIKSKDIEAMWENIKKISSMCEDYSLKKPLKIPSLPWKDAPDVDVRSNLLNEIPMLKTFLSSSFDGDVKLGEIIVDKLNTTPSLCYRESYDEINMNLAMIWESSEVNNAHWSAYLLNLQKIIDECWNAGTIVGPSRGSGGGFYLLYILDIIQLDKLRETTILYPWRFLNPVRVSPLDIDIDISGLKRSKVLAKMRKIYGEDRVAGVATFRTETAKSAILTAARGLGIEVDEAHHLAAMIPADRGILRTLTQCFYGDKENDLKPVAEFVKAMKYDYPEVWEVAQEIENLICGYG